MTDLIGQMLGKYQVLDQIGMGGMATVYKAYQASMDRYVAIKVLPRQLAEDPTFVGRFEQEARTIAKLEHTHILPVYDYGAQEGYTYLVMRYIGSGSLKDLTRRGALPLPEAVEYVAQIADALQYAHERGVIHRDVKTSNVLLSEDRQTYLTDFGIAKLTESSAHFTGTGAVVGTPTYMSPEQCSGQLVDARSDIYSLGVVLYEMITGVVPFEAETPVAVVLKHLQEPMPSPRRINPNIPEAVEKVVLRALAKAPDERFQSARDMANALREALEEFAQKQTVEMRVTPPPPSLDATHQALHAPSETMTRPDEPTHLLRRVQKRPAWLIWAAAACVLVLVVAVVAIMVLSGNKNTDKDGSGPSGAVTPPGGESSVASGAVTPPGGDSSVVSGAASARTIFTSSRAEWSGDHQLLVTPNGLWMSSPGGLVFWTLDGQATKYTAADGLAFQPVAAMAVDPDGSMWLGGGGAQDGLMRVQFTPEGKIAKTDTFSSDEQNMNTTNIFALLPEADGTLLAGTYDSLIEQWDGSQWRSPDFPTRGSDLETVGDRVWALLRTRDGSLWAGGPNGLAHWDGTAWSAVPMPEEIVARNQQDHSIEMLYEDPADGSLWAALYTQPEYQDYTLHLMPPAETGGDWTWQPVDDWVPEEMNSILRAADGTLWLVSYRSVIRVDGATGQRTIFDEEDSILGDQYFDIVQDAGGTIWLTTTDRLYKFDGRRWIPFTVPNEPPTNLLTRMAEGPDGTLWFIDGYGTICTYKDGTWTTTEGLRVDNTNDITVQGEALWIATSDGLYRLQNGAVKRYGTDEGLPALMVTVLAFDPANPDLLWVGTLRGLGLLNTADGTITTWTPEKDDFPGPTIATLAFDPAGTLWVGAGYSEDRTGPGGQIALLRRQGDGWETVGAPGAPFTDAEHAVLSLADDGQGGVWVGTDYSLYHWDGTTWKQYHAEDGAPDSTAIPGILVDGDVIWVGTQYEGLFRLDSIGWFRTSRDILGTTHVFGLYRTSDGAMWVLTADGIVRLVGDPMELE